jgi:hypothetical protein
MKFATCFMLVSYLTYSSTLKMEEACSSEHWLTISGLHDIISQKIEFFISMFLYDIFVQNIC